MEKMKRIKKRLSLTLRSSQTIDESLSELAEQMTIEDGGTKDNGQFGLLQHQIIRAELLSLLLQQHSMQASRLTFSDGSIST